MRRCAFLTTDDLTHFVTDEDLTLAPLAALGWRAEPVSWRSDTDWTAYDLVVVRTPWDYQRAPAEFAAVLQRIDTMTRLQNPLALMLWNMDKRYIRELGDAGVCIPPTWWCNSPQQSQVRDAAARFGVDEIVIKPRIGANANDTLRLRAGDDAAVNHAVALFRGRDCMVQPFLHNVVEEGEFSVIFLGGSVSHTILKTPKARDFRVQEEHGGRIRAVVPEPLLLERALHAMAAAQRIVPGPAPLYGRVDLVRTGDGDFALMELEVIEPSLYFRMDAAAPARFAHAVDQHAAVAAR